MYASEYNRGCVGHCVQCKLFIHDQAYCGATTVAEYKAAGGTTADLKHDLKMGFVVHVDP